MRKYQLYILALSEIRWTGPGEKQLDNQCIIFYSSPEIRPKKGAAHMMTRGTSRFLLKWTPIFSRILVAARFSGSQAKVSIVVCYASTNITETDCKEEFYQTLQSVVNSIPKQKITCILGDLNYVVGNEELYCLQGLSWHGMGMPNRNGTMIIDFTIANDLVIG